MTKDVVAKEANAVCGSIYVPEIDDLWYFVCIVEDNIYDFTWDTNDCDPCRVCKHVIDIKCKGYSKDCSSLDIMESLKAKFETKIINKYKGK